MDFAIMRSALVGAGVSAARATQKQRRGLMRRVRTLTGQRDRLIGARLAGVAALEKSKRGKRKQSGIKAALGETQARLVLCVAALRSAVVDLRDFSGARGAVGA